MHMYIHVHVYRDMLTLHNISITNETEFVEGINFNLLIIADHVTYGQSDNGNRL